MFHSFTAIAISLLTMFLVRPEQGAQQSASKMAFDPESMPKVDEGAPQCVVFGDVWINDWQVLSFGNPRTKAIKMSSGK